MSAPHFNALRNPLPVIAEWVWSRLAAGARMALHVANDGVVYLRAVCKTFTPLPDAWLVAIYSKRATLDQIMEDLSARLSELVNPGLRRAA